MKRTALIIFAIFWLVALTVACFGQKVKPVKIDSNKVKIAILKAQYETASANIRSCESNLEKAKRQLTTKNAALHSNNDKINKLTEDLEFYKMVFDNSKLFADYVSERLSKVYVITERHISNKRKVKLIKELLKA